MRCYCCCSESVDVMSRGPSTQPVDALPLITQPLTPPPIAAASLPSVLIERLVVAPDKLRPQQQQQQQPGGPIGPSVLDTDSDVLTLTPIGPLPTLPAQLALDHNYCAPYHPDYDEALPPACQAPPPAKQKPARRPAKRRLADVTNVLGDSRELSSLLPPAAVRPTARPAYKPRDLGAELLALYEFLIIGVDCEDSEYLRQCYQHLLQYDNTLTDWLNETHWVDHPPTCLPDLPQSCRHSTGPPGEETANWTPAHSPRQKLHTSQVTG